MAEAFIERHKEPQRKPKGEEEEDRWRACGVPFGEAYEDELKRDKKGRIGPLDIYSRHHVRLLCLYLLRPKACVEWGRMEQKWRVPVGPMALGPFISRLGTPAKRRKATHTVNVGLAEGGLPSSRGTKV